ncbi:MAG: alpha/beta hydrolase [Burkholderiaceae bacterium]|nr:alpha/beta hydrolase [Burkholderiaceae bacterium]
MSHQPKLHHTEANGLSLASFEWRAPLRGQGPTLWFVHATGFHGRVWDPLIHHLPGRHAIAIEQRGHGRSGGTDFDSWADFGRDQAALAAAFDLQGAVGIGHSMGAHALVQAAAFEPGRFRQLILIDPVLLAPADYHLPPVEPGTLHPAAGRKNAFESPQAMFERFADRAPYSVFDPEALRSYCQHGLRPADDGRGFQLACAPAFEGKVYPYARQNPGVYASIRALQIPVLVVRARPQDPGIKPWDPLGSPTWPPLAQEFRRGRDLQLLDKTHFLPMEDPQGTAALIADAIASAA